MKTALLFSGKLGDWRGCSDSIFENIIKPLNPDIFLTTWEGEDADNFSKTFNLASSRLLNLKDCIKLLNPKELIRESSKGLIPMLAGMKSVHSLYREYEQEKSISYDLVIRLRPDIQILEVVNQEQIDDCIKSKHISLPFFESDNIYDHEEEMKKEFSFSFVYDKASLPNQINDQFTIGHPDEMDKYMNCISRVSEAIGKLWDEGYPEYMIKVPESVITICLQLQNCNYKQLKGSNSFGNIKTFLCKNGKKWRNRGHTSTIAE